jgi:hypothetical protein
MLRVIKKINEEKSLNFKPTCKQPHPDLLFNKGHFAV